jgi:hypothetical protein
MLCYKMGECFGEGIGNDMVSWAAAGAGGETLLAEGDRRGDGTLPSSIDNFFHFHYINMC